MLEQKADKGSLYGAVFLAGWIACAATNHLSQLWSEHGQLKVIQTQVVPKLKAKVACEHKRGVVIEKVAKQGIASAVSDSVPVPSSAAIPADNCAP